MQRADGLQMYHFLNNCILVPLSLVEMEVKLLISVKTKITASRILQHIILSYVWCPDVNKTIQWSEINL